jgi:hypothetical protein
MHAAGPEEDTVDRRVMFMTCPAYLGDRGAARCGLPAEVKARYLMDSTDGPLESATISCPRGHHFSGPIEYLTVPGPPATAARPAAPARARRD